MSFCDTPYVPGSSKIMHIVCTRIFGYGSLKQNRIKKEYNAYIVLYIRLLKFFQDFKPLIGSFPDPELFEIKHWQHVWHITFTDETLKGCIGGFF